jgi:electron transport complex protein RnfE
MNELRKGLWAQNPVFVSVLGLCPSMAVTNSLGNALLMGFATLFVLLFASVMVSALRRFIPSGVRITVFIIIIATFVSVVDFVLAASMPVAHKQLGAFISLIVVNCLIMGRQEAFASKNAVWPSILDAVGMGLGFTLALSCIGAIRELFGAGTLLGHSVFGPSFEPWTIMLLPPGGFFCLGGLLALLASIAERRARAVTRLEKSQPGLAPHEEHVHV